MTGEKREWQLGVGHAVIYAHVGWWGIAIRRKCLAMRAERIREKYRLSRISPHY
jgi:hypothetical protein